MQPKNEHTMDEHWRRTRQTWNRRGLRFGLYLAIPLFPLFGLLDLVALPSEWLTKAVTMRVFVSIIGVVILMFLNDAKIKRRFVPITAGYTLVTGLGVSALAFVGGGFDSTYWSGLNLIMLVAGMLFVWPTKVSIPVYAFLVASFILPSMLTLNDGNIAVALEASFFVLATAALLVTAQAFRYRSLRQEADASFEVGRLSEELRQANVFLAELARIDALTRVGNRLAFDERYEEEWSRMRRTSNDLALLMIDVDRFKIYNDTFGHPKGDVCLKALAQTLSQTLSRPGDFVARYGGEEFAVILPETDADGARVVAEKLRKAVEELAIDQAAGADRRIITVSVGGPSTEGFHFDNPIELVEAADEALYRAKDNGRNITEVAAPGLGTLRESR